MQGAGIVDAACRDIPLSPAATTLPRSLDDETTEGPTNNSSPRIPAVRASYGHGSRDTSLQWTYRNNLLAAIGFLDLANALDFPANVWNSIPPPLFARVLMGLGGGICTLTTAFAFWDLHRGRRNVQFLMQERAYLKAKEVEDTLSRIEQAWLDTNFRELGWEVLDRMLLDIILGVSGILVGAGTLLAIRGDIPQIYKASNLMSGYIGNSFVAAYALVNVAWSVYLWKRARKHELAVKNVTGQIPQHVMLPLKHQSRWHKLYAVLTAITIVISGVGSEISATMWAGYVVLIPAIISSVFCNYLWRLRVNYNRLEIRDCSWIRRVDLLERLSAMARIMRSFTSDASSASFCGEDAATPEKAIELLCTLGLYDDFRAKMFPQGLGSSAQKYGGKDLDKFQAVINLPANATTVLAIVNQCVRDAGRSRFRDEERFLLELYGCYLCTKEPEAAKEKKEAIQMSSAVDSIQSRSIDQLAEYESEERNGLMSGHELGERSVSEKQPVGPRSLEEHNLPGNFNVEPNSDCVVAR